MSTSFDSRRPFPDTIPSGSADLLALQYAIPTTATTTTASAATITHLRAFFEAMQPSTAPALLLH